MQRNATTDRAGAPARGHLGQFRNAVSLAVVFSLTSATVTQAADCGAMAEEIGALISSFGTTTSQEGKGTENDYADAASKNYAKDFFDGFDKLNAKAKQAQDLVNTTYNLTGYTAVFSEGQVQKAIPPMVTNTMANAEELARAAANEENTKLDIAQLRCSQSTEDAALAVFLAQADSKTVDSYTSTKKAACRVVHVLGDIQDTRKKLNNIRQNGYPIFYLAAKETKKFAHKYKRTIQFKIDLRMFPEYPDGAMGVNGEDQPVLLGQLDGIRLSYNSYFKFSDDAWTPLNLYQYFISDTRKDDYRCPVKLKMTSRVDVQLCLKTEDFTANSVTVRAKARFDYRGDSHDVSLGAANIPAPFGYLAKLSDMKEKKMQQLQSKVVKRMASLLGSHADLLGKTSNWKNTCS